MERFPRDRSRVWVLACLQTYPPVSWWDNKLSQLRRGVSILARGTEPATSGSIPSPLQSSRTPRTNIQFWRHSFCGLYRTRSAAQEERGPHAWKSNHMMPLIQLNVCTAVSILAWVAHTCAWANVHESDKLFCTPVWTATMRLVVDKSWEHSTLKHLTKN